MLQLRDALYRYMADAGLFTECLTRRRLPVAHEGDSAALEAAYLGTRRQPGQELKVSLIGRMVARPKPENAGEQQVLVVEGFEDIWPGESCGARMATADLENTYWRLTRLEEDSVIPVDGQREPHLILRSQEHRASGSDGCNRFFGGYRLDANRLVFDTLASTKMAYAAGMDTAFSASRDRMT